MNEEKTLSAPISALLLPLAKNTENLTVLNNFVRNCYLSLLPVLKYFLSCVSKNVIEHIEARNSVLAPGAFNVFRSDLDLSLIIKPTAETKEIDRLVSAYTSVRKFLPFLGEIEIYTSSENQALKELYASHGEIIDGINQLRKWNWQVTKVRSAKTEYHKWKAERSLLSILKRFNLAEENTNDSTNALLSNALAIMINDYVSDDAKSVIKRLSSEIGPIVGESKFLGWRLSINEKQSLAIGSDTLLFKAENGLFVAAILPDGEEAFPNIRNLIRKLRDNQSIARTHKALCAREYLLCRSVERTNGSSEQLRQWTSFLKTQLIAISFINLLSKEFLEC